MTVMRIAALSAVLAAPLAAQSDYRPIGTLGPDVNPTIVAPVDPNLPQYRVGAGDTRFDGVVRLIMNTTAGNFVCSGSLLDRSGRTGILAAAHCFTNTSGVNITNSVTVEFRSAQTGALLSSSTTAGSNISIKSGYTGAVVDQRDVAFIRLTSAVPTGIGGNGYELYSGGNIMGQNINLAGYGQTGDGTSGSIGGAQTWMRYGQNRFDTSCLNGSTTAANCAGTLAGNPSTNLNGFGGVLLGDFDNPGGNNAASLTCFRHGQCENGVLGLPGEVNIGGGDSGSAAFLDATNTILGVASFGSRRTDLTPVPPFGAFGTAFGYACVGAVSGNAVCNENYQFVQSFLVPTVVIPEPSTYALLGTGLVAMGLVARRRRSAK